MRATLEELGGLCIPGSGSPSCYPGSRMETLINLEENPIV